MATVVAIARRNPSLRHAEVMRQPPPLPEFGITLDLAFMSAVVPRTL